MSRPRHSRSSSRGQRFESPGKSRHASSGSSSSSVGYTTSPYHSPGLFREEDIVVPPYTGPSVRSFNPGRDRRPEVPVDSHHSSPPVFLTGSTGNPKPKQSRNAISPKQIRQAIFGKAPPVKLTDNDVLPARSPAKVNPPPPVEQPRPMETPIKPQAPLATRSPAMFGLMVQGRQPITRYDYEGTKYTFTIPCEPQFTSSPFYFCVYLSEWYRLQPYSYVVVYFSESATGPQEWSKLGNIDAKSQNLFLHCPPLRGKGHSARIGLEIVGQLPRELKSPDDIFGDPTASFQRLLEQPDSFDVVQARSLLLHTAVLCSNSEVLLALAEQRLGQLEQIATLRCGAVYISQLAGVLVWLKEQILCLIGECPRLAEARLRLEALSKMRWPASAEATSFAENAFCMHLTGLCGDIMARANKITGDPAGRLDTGARLLSQCELGLQQELECLESIFAIEVVSACMQAANEKVNHFFGWIEANFIDDAPAELRSEARKLTAKVEKLLSAFEHGVPWYH